MTFEFAYAASALGPLAKAAAVNVAFAVLSIVLGLALSAALTVLRQAMHRAALLPLDLFLTFIRGTPLLVQIFMFYYLLPAVGVRLSAFAAALAALTLHSAAFMVEIMRGGLAAIPPGQVEGARALGLRNATIWRKVLLPQMAVRIIGPLINEFTLMLKATPLVSVIAITESLRTAQQIFSVNYRAVETLTSLALIFLVLNLAVSRIGKAVERHMRIRTA